MASKVAPLDFISWNHVSVDFPIFEGKLDLMTSF